MGIPQLSERQSFRHILAIGAIGFLSIILALLNWSFGNQQFGGHDQGVMVDIAYRLYVGQKPYQEFYSTVPVLFFLGSLWGLQLFGLSWGAFPGMAALFSVLTFWLLVFMMHRMHVPRKWALLIAFTAEMLGVVSLGYWWYNSISSIIVCLLLCAGMLVVRRPEIKLHWALLTFCAFLAWLGKPNTGFLTIGAVYGFLLLHPSCRVKAMLSGIVSLFLVVLMLGAYHINAHDVLASYLIVAGRGLPSWQRFRQDQPDDLVYISCLTLFLALWPGIATLGTAVFQKKKLQFQPSPGLLGIVAAGIAIGLFACFTNGELKFTDEPMVWVPGAILCVLLQPGYEEKPSTKSLLQRPTLLWIGLPSSVLLLMGFLIGASRYRVAVIGIGNFYEVAPLTLIGERNAFFSTLWCGPAMEDVMSVMTKNINQQREILGREPNVFMGSRVQFGYAAFNLTPPKHMPIIWDVRVGVSKAQMPGIIQAFKDEKFDLCFFRDYTFIPRDIQQYLLKNYKIRHKKTDNLIVCTRKKTE